MELTNINLIISEIQLLALVVSNKTDNKIFTSYSGHVNAFEVWTQKDSKINYLCSLYMDRTKIDEIKSELKKCKQLLISMINEETYEYTMHISETKRLDHTIEICSKLKEDELDKLLDQLDNDSSINNLHEYIAKLKDSRFISKVKSIIQDDIGTGNTIKCEEFELED